MARSRPIARLQTARTMAKDFDTLEDSNRSSNPSIHQLSDPARRLFLRGGVGAAATGLLAPLAGCATTGEIGRAHV